PLLRAALDAETGQPALEALWGLYVSGGFDEPTAAKTLAHRDPYVRLWTVRLACDFGQVSPSLARQMAELAVAEPHVEVRSQLACSARRIDAANGLAIVRGLLRHAEDASDPHLPLLIWWAIEARAASDGAAIQALFTDKSLWSEKLV